MSLRRVSVPLVLLLLSNSAPASAQDIVNSSFSTQLMEPAMGLDAIFSVEGPQVSEHMGFTLGLMLNYQNRPLVLYFDTREGVASGDLDLSKAQEVPLVEHQLTANVTGSFAVRYRWIKAQVGIDIPVDLLTSGREVDQLGEVTADYILLGMGEIKVQLKFLLLDDWKGLSLALSPVLTIPTGQFMDYSGDGSVGVRPRIVLGYRRGDLGLALNLGYLIRENTTLFSSEVGDQLMYGLGASYQVHPRVTLLGEVFGRAGFATESGCSWDLKDQKRVCTGSSSSDSDAFPLEADLGVRVPLGSGLDVTAGAGMGIIRAIGSPAVRALAGLRWAPDFRDTDADGVYDRVDKCPTQAEDKDGFQDEDGCPDPDNDSDLIPDIRDKCPNAAEDRDTFEDEDGCPDLDNDKDGIDDLHDACPFKPETRNSFQDEDGCPDVPDQDGDGVEDSQDKCPKDPEDKDGWEDEDGCPDVDNDMDGVPDQFDDCALEAEDMDGFQDDDGCPDLDNDKDGVPDETDKCPTEPETINGVDDEDGCPDKGQSHVVVEKDRIIITQKVYFDTGKDTIKARSLPVLGELALILKANPQVRKLSIEGHTDNMGDAAANKDLSYRLARSVLAYLVQNGIPEGRLAAVGHGQEKPIANNKTAKGREENRRVEFLIIDTAEAAPTTNESK